MNTSRWIVIAYLDNGESFALRSRMDWDKLSTESLVAQRALSTALIESVADSSKLFIPTSKVSCLSVTLNPAYELDINGEFGMSKPPENPLDGQMVDGLERYGSEPVSILESKD